MVWTCVQFHTRRNRGVRHRNLKGLNPHRVHLRTVLGSIIYYYVNIYKYTYAYCSYYSIFHSILEYKKQCFIKRDFIFPLNKDIEENNIFHSMKGYKNFCSIEERKFFHSMELYDFLSTEEYKNFYIWNKIIFSILLRDSRIFALCEGEKKFRSIEEYKNFHSMEGNNIFHSIERYKNFHSMEGNDILHSIEGCKSFHSVEGIYIFPFHREIQKNSCVKGSVQQKLRPMLLYIIQKLFSRRWTA